MGSWTCWWGTASWGWRTDKIISGKNGYVNVSTACSYIYVCKRKLKYLIYRGNFTVPFQVELVYILKNSSIVKQLF